MTLLQYLYARAKRAKRKDFWHMLPSGGLGDLAGARRGGLLLVQTCSNHVFKHNLKIDKKLSAIWMGTWPLNGLPNFGSCPRSLPGRWASGSMAKHYWPGVPPVQLWFMTESCTIKAVLVFAARRHRELLAWWFVMSPANHGETIVPHGPWFEFFQQFPYTLLKHWSFARIPVSTPLCESNWGSIHHS